MRPQRQLVRLESADLPENLNRNAFFGDLHVHTRYSFDAFIFGTTASPDDAYRYAKGSAIKHPLGFDMQLDDPLDFYAVTDHAAWLGMIRAYADPTTKPGKFGVRISISTALPLLKAAAQLQRTPMRSVALQGEN